MKTRIVATVTMSVSMGILLACAPLFAGASGSGGMGGSMGGPSGTSDQPSGRSPQQMAVDYYNSGVGHRQRALSYLKDASAATNDKDRQKNQKKAEDQFQSAVKDYKKALSYNKGLYQAMNELGFAYRKLGDYENSLKQYDAALALKPGFAPALEYRGEAYLGLAKYEETKNAYLELYRTDQDHAALLMQAFDDWVAKLPASPSADASAFAAWVGERKKVAGVTQVEPSKLERNW